MVKPKTLKEWFFIRGDRQNFKPNVRRDANVIFCHDKMIVDGARASIEKSFATGEPVKMMVYGDWGVGKTHTVQHIKWWLENEYDSFPTKVVFLELGDITKKTRFDLIIRAILDNIGLDEIVRLAGNYMGKTGTFLPDGLRQVGVGKDVADAYQKFLSASPGDVPTQLVTYALEHLKGGAVKEATSIGLTPQLVQSNEYFDVLVSLGHLYESVDGKHLIIIADEAAKLESVSGDEATESHWIAANRLIFDDNNTHFGFIYTLSARHPDDFPEVLIHQQIVSRLGESNLIELPNLSGPEAREFVKKLVMDFVDMEAVTALTASGEGGSGFDKESYPFTKEGFEHFIEYWNLNQTKSKPRDIADKMNDAGFVALKTNKRLIDSACLTAANM